MYLGDLFAPSGPCSRFLTFELATDVIRDRVRLGAPPSRSEFMDADDTKKQDILSKLLWNLSIKNKTVAEVSYKSSYGILAKIPKNADILLDVYPF